MPEERKPLVGEERKPQADSRHQSITYKPIPTDDQKEDENETENLSCGARLLNDIRFQNAMGAVIVLNGAVIGMETDFPDWGHWTDVENGFLMIFLCEVVLKMAVEGIQFAHPYAPDFFWNMFDSLIVGLGVFDVIATFIGTGGSGGFATVFRMVRLLRILRIFRLLKFLKRLFLLAMGLIEACKAVFWVTILMAFVLYMCAIVLVKLVGRPPADDPHKTFLNYHFGSIVESMITLFVLMSSPNLPIYQDETGLLESKPLLTIFLIIFITFGSFGMIAMLTGVINESMFENNELKKEEKRLEHEAQRRLLGERAIEIFENLNVDENGEVPLDDIKKLAPQMLALLEAAGARVDHGDILKLIENTDVDDSGTINIEEFVHAMEKVAEGLTPLTMLEVHHAVGACTRKLVDLEGQILNSVKQTNIIMEKMEKQEELAIKSEDAMSQHIGDMGHAMEELASRFDNSRDGEGKQTELLADIALSMRQRDSGSNISELKLAIAEEMAAFGSSLQKLSDQTESIDTRVQLAVSRAFAETDKAAADRSFRSDISQQMREMQAAHIEEIQGSMHQVMEEKKLGEVAQSIQKISDQIDRSLSGQIGEIKTFVQRLLEQKDYGDIGGSSFSVRTAPQVENSTLAQYMQEIQASVQRLVERRDGAESRGFIARPSSSGAAPEEERTMQMPSQAVSEISCQVADLVKDVKNLSDQLDRSETRVQISVSQQIGDVKSCLESLGNHQSKSSFSSAADSISPMLAQQLVEMKELLNQRDSCGFSPQQIADVRSCLQNLPEQRDVGRTFPQPKEQISLDEMRNFFDVSISEIHTTIQKSFEKRDGDREEHFRSSVSLQMAEIARSMQMLLERGKSQEGLPYTVSHHLAEIQKSVQISQQIEDMRKAVEFLIQKEGNSEIHLQGMHRAMDATQKSLLGAVGELGGVILGGVADLLARKAISNHQDSTGTASSSDISALRHMLAAQPSREYPRPSSPMSPAASFRGPV